MIDRYKNCYYRNWPAWGWEVPQSAVCKLMNQESSGVTQTEFKVLRINGLMALSPGLNLKAWETRSIRGMEKVDVSVQAERANSPFLCLSVPFRLSTIGWGLPLPPPPRTGESDLDLVCWFKCYSLLETPSQTHTEIKFSSSLGIR